MTTVTTGRRPESTRGRKRDDERTDAIVQAAGELLLEQGYDKLRIQDVADRAGSGTGAIYRRWETKEALVADAIRAMPDPEHIATDDPLADLEAVIAEKAESACAQPDLFPGLISAMRTCPEIEAAVHERYSVDMYRRIMERVVGPDHPQLDLLAELAPAIAMHRVTVTGEDIEAGTLARNLMALAEAASTAR